MCWCCGQPPPMPIHLSTHPEHVQLLRYNTSMFRRDNSPEPRQEKVSKSGPTKFSNTLEGCFSQENMCYAGDYTLGLRSHHYQLVAAMYIVRQNYDNNPAAAAIKKNNSSLPYSIGLCCNIEREITVISSHPRRGLIVRSTVRPARTPFEWRSSQPLPAPGAIYPRSR